MLSYFKYMTILITLLALAIANESEAQFLAADNSASYSGNWNAYAGYEYERYGTLESHNALPPARAGSGDYANNNVRGYERYSQATGQFRNNQAPYYPPANQGGANAAQVAPPTYQPPPQGYAQPRGYYNPYPPATSPQAVPQDPYYQYPDNDSNYNTIYESYYDY